MNRRRTSVVALAVAALTAGSAAAPAPAQAGGARAAAPTSTPTPTPTVSPTPSPTQSDGTLQILTYRGYAEYGGVSSRVNWVGSFEKETGCRIARLETVQTAEEMAARVAQRPYDVISAGPALLGSLVENRQAQPVDPAKIDGWQDIPKRFRDLATVSGKAYGVPYLWGYHEFLYDASRVKGGDVEEAFTSERSALRNSPMTIADAALALGDDEPYELGKDRLGEAVRLLEQAKGRTYWQNPVDLVKGFATGDLDYAQATPYYRVLLRKAGLPVKTLDAKRTTGWVDSWVLGANLPDVTCAYRWINWMTQAGTQRDAAAWTGLAPANVKACKGRARPVCEMYGAGPAPTGARAKDQDKRLDRVLFAVRPPGGCKGGAAKCVPYATWTERWDALVP
uniref:extracellular solute-binding protein n=1 Tax=Nonomuraea pusilla TaxID=46177 RepID=UPI000AE041B7|nr:extracellular solute-binding protein [Nonomuraea pusilla]